MRDCVTMRLRDDGASWQADSTFKGWHLGVNNVTVHIQFRDHYA